MENHSEISSPSTWFPGCELTTVIEHSIPQLMKELTSVIGAQITDDLKQQMGRWRNGDIKTLNEVYEKITMTESSTRASLCRQVTARWAEESVGKAVLSKVSGAAGNFPDTVETLSVVISSLSAESNEEVYKKISGVILQNVQEYLALTLFEIVNSLGPLRAMLIAAILGLSSSAAAGGKLDLMKSIFVEKASSADLPPVLRRCVTDAKIDNLLSGQRMAQIEETLCDTAFTHPLTEAMVGQIRVVLSARYE